MEAARPRSRRPAEERRAQILEAAWRCFSDKGFHASTMDDLVRASGLSKGSLYWHFQSKEDVFLALFDSFSESLFAEWDELIDQGLSTLEAAQRAAFDKIDVLGGEGGLSAWIEFFRHPQARERLSAVYVETRTRLSASLAREMDAGRVRRQSPDALAASITALGEGLMLQAMVDPTFELKRHLEASLDLLKRGMRP